MSIAFNADAVMSAMSNLLSQLHLMFNFGYNNFTLNI